MRAFIFAVLALMLSMPTHAAKSGANPGGKFGLGILVGEPSALTAKYALDQRTALQGGLSFFYSGWTLVYLDWLYQFSGALGRQNEFLAQTTPYIGIGGVLVATTLGRYESRRNRYLLESNDATLALGVRIPLGAEWRAPTIPLGVFLEIAPGLAIVPGTIGFVHFGIGARFYF